MTNLFEEFEEREEESSTEENSVQKSFDSKRDKIFNNDYNTGNLDFEEYGIPKVDQDFVDKHMESLYDSNEYYQKMKNMEKLNEFYKDTEISQIIGIKKKIPKQLISRLYLDLRGAFEIGELQETEYFTLLGEYFGLSYEVFYENIPAIYRESLVRELDQKYGILKRRGIKKLF